MSTILYQLHVDHINVANLLDVMERQFDELQLQGDTDYGLLADIMLYMTRYPDLYHHPKEDLLFERLQVRAPELSDLLDILVREHQQLAINGQALLKALHDADLSGVEPTDVLAKGADYIKLLRRHMDREEAEVFPGALQKLTDEDWEIINARMAPQNDPLFGSFVASQFRKRYDQIMQLVHQ